MLLPKIQLVLYLHNIVYCRTTKIVFAENQLSPDSIGISPLVKAHPRILQQSPVRSST